MREDVLLKVSVNEVDSPFRIPSNESYTQEVVFVHPRADRSLSEYCSKVDERKTRRSTEREREREREELVSPRLFIDDDLYVTNAGTVPLVRLLSIEKESGRRSRRRGNRCDRDRESEECRLADLSLKRRSIDGFVTSP